MPTRAALIPSNKNDLFFDDRSLLEAALGNKALTITSINANCDCDGYYADQNDENLNPYQISASAVTAY